MEQFAKFIDKLATDKDGDGTLLDHSMMVYGSGISDGNKHLHNDLPVLAVGRATLPGKPAVTSSIRQRRR